MDDGTEERWLPVAGYEGAYEVSNKGRVRKLRVLKPRPTHDGYLRVNLSDGHGAKRDGYIQVLVAEAFLGPRPEGCEVLHGPSGVADNSLANLSYGTHLDNCDDRARDGRYHFKLTQAAAAEIRAKSAAGATAKSLAEEYGVVRWTIYRILEGERWAPRAPEVLPAKRRRLTADQVREMRDAYESGAPVPEMIQHFGMSRSGVYRMIAAGEWKRDAA